MTDKSMRRSTGFQRHERKGGAVLAVVIIHGEVPPGAVLALEGEQDFRQVVLEERPLVFRKLPQALGSVIMAVVKEIGRHLEMRLVWDGTLARHIEPEVAQKADRAKRS